MRSVSQYKFETPVLTDPSIQEISSMYEALISKQKSLPLQL